MKKYYTLEEVRNIASGCYCSGYLSVFDDEEDVDVNDSEQIDFLIGKYCETRSENERRICVLS